jgi:ABC-type multidrug transport system ATPase subunit
MPQPAPSPPARTPLASAQSVRFSYGATPVFENLDLAIPAGLTLLHGGESCGKSTLLRLLGGALKPEEGAIKWLWMDSAQSPIDATQHDIYWIDPREERHDADSARTYFDQLRVRHSRFSFATLDALVRDLGLSEHLEKPLYMLSTGSKRKVWLAGAFASRCRLTLIDEPFAALDQRSVACVRNWLNRVAGDTECAWVIADYAAPEGVAVTHQVALDA